MYNFEGGKVIIARGKLKIQRKVVRIALCKLNILYFKENRPEILRKSQNRKMTILTGRNNSAWKTPGKP